MLEINDFITTGTVFEFYVTVLIQELSVTLGILDNNGIHVLNYDTEEYRTIATGFGFINGKGQLKGHARGMDGRVHQEVPYECFSIFSKVAVVF